LQFCLQTLGKWCPFWCPCHFKEIADKL
jgi:hypothetical protein